MVDVISRNRKSLIERLREKASASPDMSALLDQTPRDSTADPLHVIYSIQRQRNWKQKNVAFSESGGVLSGYMPFPIWTGPFLAISLEAFEGRADARRTLHVADRIVDALRELLEIEQIDLLDCVEGSFNFNLKFGSVAEGTLAGVASAAFMLLLTSPPKEKLTDFYKACAAAVDVGGFCRAAVYADGGAVIVIRGMREPETPNDTVQRYNLVGSFRYWPAIGAAGNAGQMGKFQVKGHDSEPVIVVDRRRVKALFEPGEAVRISGHWREAAGQEIFIMDDAWKLNQVSGLDAFYGDGVD